MKHPLVLLAERLDWQSLDVALSTNICSTTGNTALPTRLVAGLLYLQHTYNLSDEAVCAQWVENPYWQYFCGEVYFQQSPPCHPTSLTKWRKRMGKAGCEALLAATIACAKSSGFLSVKQCQEIIVDTTVQEKNISHPTDSKLLDKARQNLVALGKAHQLELRQNYNVVCKQLLWSIGGYGRAKQYKRMHNIIKKHKTRVGRVFRDTQRKLEQHGDVDKSAFATTLEQCDRLLKQQRNSKNKLYSLHAPEVECLSKGKAHKQYEFGVKASYALSQTGNWVLGAQSCPGNPYDGHTLKTQVQQTQRLTQDSVKVSRTDKGYRGKLSQVEGVKLIHSGLSKKGMSRGDVAKLNRRNAIEPIIGHMKRDGKLGRCYLKGMPGDMMNVILSGAGQNMRKLLKLLKDFFVLILWLLIPPYRSNFEFIQPKVAS